MLAPQSLAHVRDMLNARIQPLAAETISVQQAFRRIPLTNPRSPVNLPAFERAAMDGFTIRSEDVADSSPHRPVRLQITGEILAGQSALPSLGRLQAIRITTGASIPPGADCVVPIEEVSERSDTEIVLTKPLPPGKHVIRIGEDLKQGDSVLPAAAMKRELRAQDIALLVATGIREIEVVRKPRVQTIVTGDELLRPGAAPRGVQIVDSNSPMLSALCQRDGAIDFGIQYVRDDPASLQQAIQSTAADVVLLCGGTSVGASDFAASVVSQLGELPVHGIKLRPGAPLGVGFLNDHRVVFLLPGNPVACLCAYDLVAGVAIRRLGSRSDALPYSQVEARLSKTLRSEPGRVEYVRLRLHAGIAEPVPGGASRLSSVVHADGFTLIPENCLELQAGESIPVWVY